MPNNLQTIIGESEPTETDIDAQPLPVSSALFNQRFSQDTGERKLLGRWSAWVVSVWLLLVILIICLNRYWKFGLSDTVLSVLLGTTTLNILGLTYIVLRGLFDKK